MKDRHLDEVSNIVTAEISIATKPCPSALQTMMGAYGRELENMNATEVLEWASATSPQDYPDEWVWLTTKFLGLTSIHALAVQEVLKQGRWRKARNPKSYVKVCASREIHRMGLGDDPVKDFPLLVPKVSDEQGRVLAHDAYIDYLIYDRPIKKSGVWRHRNPNSGYDQSDCDEYGTWLTPRERLLQRVPDEFKKDDALPPAIKKLYECLNARHDSAVFFSTGPTTKVNWRSLAARAGLDRGEYYVLLCRVFGVSRERAVAKWKASRKRRWVEAAWRRFNRSGVERLRAAMRQRQESL